MAVLKPRNGQYRQMVGLTLLALLVLLSSHGLAGSQAEFWAELDGVCGSESRADKKVFFQRNLLPDTKDKRNGSAVGPGLLALEQFQADHPTLAQQARLEDWFGFRLLALLCQERELATQSKPASRQLKGVWQGENQSPSLVELYSVSEAVSIPLFSEFSRAIAALAKEGDGLISILNRELTEETEEPALYKQASPTTPAADKLAEPVPTQLESCMKMLDAKQYLISPTPGKSAFSCLRSVLAQEPDNREAMDGLQFIENSYFSSSSKGLKRGDPQLFFTYYRRLATVNKNSRLLAKLKEDYCRTLSIVERQSVVWSVYRDPPPCQTEAVVVLPSSD
ncbi:MAG: hypothetical protein HQL72_11875 [Magnetococcales bacterium]|nr:hypothetical protein [Magnetococcales bacterium]